LKAAEPEPSPAPAVVPLLNLAQPFDIEVPEVVIPEEVLEAVQVNETLSEDQKDVLLESNQNDLKIMEKIIEMEKRNQEDMLNRAIQETERAPQDVDYGEKAEELASKFAKEKEELASKIKSQHDAKLKSMLRSTSAFFDLQEDSTHDVRVMTVIGNKFAAAMRYLGIHSRLEYQKLQSQFESRVENVRKSSEKASSSSPKSMTDSMDAEVLALAEQLRVELKHVEEDEDSVREQWLKNIEDIDIDEEIQKLKEDCDARFEKFREEMRSIHEMDVATAKLAGTVRGDFGLEDRYKAECRILDAEEKSLKMIISHADSWGPKVDHHSQVNYLNNRVLSALRAEADIEMRVAMAEHGLRSEIEQITVTCDLHKRNADNMESELVLQNLADARKEKAEIVRLDTTYSFNKRIEEEKAAQAAHDSTSNFETFRVKVIQKNLLRNSRLLSKLSCTQRELLADMTAALEMKKNSQTDLLQQRSMPDEIKKLTVEEIDYETKREELELLAAFNGLRNDCALTLVQLSNVVEGFEVDIAFAAGAISFSSSNELSTLSNALAMDILKKKRSAQIDGRTLKEFEMKRLMTLERDVNDIHKIEEEIDIQTVEKLRTIDASYESDKAALSERLQKQKADKIALQNEYNDRIEAIRGQFVAKTEELARSAKDKLKAVEMSSGKDSGSRQKAKLSILQEWDGEYAEAECLYLEALCNEYLNMMARKCQMDKVNDEVRHIEQDLQQKTEAVQLALKSQSANQAEAMLKSQQNRRDEVDKLRADYERDLNGLEAQLQAKKEKQLAFNRARFEKAKAARAKQLMDTEGVSQPKAQQMAEQELGKEEARVAAEIEQTSSESYAKIRRDLENGALDDAKRLREEQEKCLSALENGLEASKKAARDALAAKQAERRRKREAELLAQKGSTVTSDEAKKQAEAELESTFDDEKKSLEHSLVDNAAAAKKAVQSDYEADTSQLRAAYEKSIANLEERLAAEKAAREKALKERLLGRRNQRLNELAAEGVPKTEALAKVEEEMAKEESNALQNIRDEFNSRASHALIGAVNEEKADASKYRSAHEKALADLEDRLRAEKLAREKALRDRLNARKPQRMQELIEAGVSPAEAAVKAEEERVAEEKAELNSIEAEFNNAVNTAKTRSDAAEDADAKKYRDEYEKALKALEERLLAEKATREKALRDRLDALKRKRVQQLVQDGVAPDKAVAQAEAELMNDEYNEMRLIQEETSDAIAQGEAKAKAKLDVDMGRYRSEHERALAALEDKLAADKLAREKALRNRLDAKNRLRADRLVQSGVPPKEANAQACAETAREEAAEMEAIATESQQTLEKARKAAAAEEETDVGKYRSDHERALAALEDRLAAEKLAKEKALRDRLAARKRSIVEELVKSGVAPVEAESQAASQIASERREGLQQIQEEYLDALADSKKASAAEADEDISRYRAAHDAAVAALESRLAAEKLAREKALRERLEAKKRKRVEELIANGMPAAQAQAQAEEEIGEELVVGLRNISNETEDTLQSGKKIAQDKFDEDVSRYRSEHEKALARLENKLEQDRLAQEKALRDRLLGRKSKRVQELLDAGKSPAEAESIASKEIEKEIASETAAVEKEAEETLARRRLEAEAQHDDAMNALKSRYDKSIAILEDGFEATRAAEHAKLKEMLAKKQAMRQAQLVGAGTDPATAKSQAQREITEEAAALAAQVDKQLEVAKQSVVESVEADYSDRMREIRASHDSKLVGLDAALANRKTKEAKGLQDRLARRKALLEQDLNATAGKSSKSGKSAAAATAANVFGEDAYLAKIAELEKRIQDEAALVKRVKEEAYREAMAGFAAQDKVLENLEATESENMRRDVIAKANDAMEKADSAASDTINAAIQASQALKDSTDDELKALRESHERELAKLNEDHLAKKHREEIALKARLDERKKKRAADLVSTGVPEETASKLASKELADDEDKQLSELHVQLKTEENKAIAEKNMEYSTAECQIIESQHEKAKEEAERALELKEQAKSKLDDIRKQHEEEAEKLTQQLNSKHASQESALKNRLAEKKRQQMAKLEADKATEEQKLAEQERLAKEEHQLLLELKQKSVEDETAEKSRIEKEQQERLEAAIKEAQQAELEAAIMATKEASLNAIREMKERAKEDVQANELKRIRDLHRQTEERMQREQESAHSANRGKLEERLAAKKAKKMKELEEQEKQQLAELQKKQQEEQEEMERLKKSKTVWKEVLQTAMDTAAANGLTGLEREEFCFSETLAKGIVPHKQINEVVERVQNMRHSAEMAALLSAQFDERITALKNVVEKVIEEKSQARMDLLNRLNTASADDETIRKELAQMEATFAEKQSAAEKKCTGALEPLHLKNQMQLRQQQFEDISRTVALYIDPETFSKMQEEAGRNKLQEMVEYRERVAAEKRQREEVAAKERADAETAMRAKFDEEMLVMQAELAEQRKKAEDEFERKKKEMAAMREELEKKRADDQGELENMEKARIIANFEKEEKAAREAMEAERQAKKSKLQNRLAQRKTIAMTANAKVPPPTTEPPAEVQKASEQTTAGQLSRQSSARGSGEGAAAAEGERPRPKQITLLKKAVKQAMGDSSAPAPVMDTTHVTNAMKSFEKLIESKLERIEKMMADNIAATASAAATAAAALEQQRQQQMHLQMQQAVQTPLQVAVGPTANIQFYHDMEEPQPGDVLEPVPDEIVNVQEKARLAFGHRLAAMIGLKKLRIRTAVSLPPSYAANNAFANSYFYQLDTDTLYVHNNRLSSSGDFGLIVIHALSHIKVRLSYS
jgi:hypothetical protein